MLTEIIVVHVLVHTVCRYDIYMWFIAMIYVAIIGMIYQGIVAMWIALNKYCGICSRHDPGSRIIR